MSLIYQSTNFIVESHDQPEIDRTEGGHIKISPIQKVTDRSELTPKQAIELMRLTIVCGLAMKSAMGKQGIEIGRINYQDNGNWKPELHIHLYCRAINATKQKYGDPIKPGHQPEFQPLSDQDIVLVKTEIESLLSTPQFSDSEWGLK